MSLIRLSLISIMVSFSLFAKAQLLINEVCPSNDVSFFDEFGDHPDWIELYNAGNESVNLDGIFITDEVDSPRKWALPAVTIAPKEFYLIIASGRDVIADAPHTNFKIAKSGEVIALFNDDRTLIDKIQIPNFETDRSFGRQTDGSSNWSYFLAPTPQDSNNGSDEIFRTVAPEFSIEMQFQSTDFELELTSTDAGADIHYTLDGSRPTENSPIYSEPILIQRTTCVRAISRKGNEIPSKIVTNNYFVGESFTLPVVAISTDSLLLFDDSTGMLVSGPDAESAFPYWGSNFWKDIEVPMHFEYFSPEGAFWVEYDLAAKVHGGRSARTKIQKSMRLLAKPEFGDDKIVFPFFSDKPQIESFEKIVLRNGSGDFEKAHIRDAFVSQYLSDEGLDLDLLGTQPVQLFLNAQYWGLMYLREKSDESFPIANYGSEYDRLDVLEEDTLTIHGNRTQFEADVDDVKSLDLTLSGNFEEAANRFDIDNMTDYFIFETAINNSDWGHNNLKLWRDQGTEGKWRYLAFDFDVGLGGRGWTTADDFYFGAKMEQYGDENPHFTIFKKLLTNADYKNHFINRYCDLLNTTFRPEIFSGAAMAYAEQVSEGHKKHFERWVDCAGCNTFERWDTLSLPKLFEFCEDKAPYAREDLMSYFELEKEVLLELNVFPEGAGSIKINTITPTQLPWTGHYFKGVPVELTIEPNPGFEFAFWEFFNEDLTNPNPNIAFDFAEDEAITAVFISEEPIAVNLNIYPNPASETISVSFMNDKVDEVSFEIIGEDGSVFTQIPQARIARGLIEESINISNLSPGHYFLKMKRGDEVFTSSFQKY